MERISIHQFSSVSLGVLLGTTFFPVAQVVTGEAGRDGWLSVLPSYALGIPFGMMVLSLGRRYPGQSLLQIAEILWGKWLGKLYGIIYTFINLYFCALLSRQGQDVINRTVLTLLPDILVLSSGMLLIFFLVKSGIEVYARFAEFVFPVVTAGLFAILILVIPRFEWTEFFPILGNGIIPVAWGAWKISGFPMEYVLFLSGVLPYLPLKEYNHLKTKIWKSVLIIGGMDAIIALTEILVFGPRETARINYGFLSLANMVEISKTISGLEAVFMGFWMGALLLKVGAFYFMTVWGLKSVGGFKGKVWPLLAVGTLVGVIGKFTGGGTRLTLDIGFVDSYMIFPLAICGTIALWGFSRLRGGHKA